MICTLCVKRGIWTKCHLLSNVAVLLRFASRFAAWCCWVLHIFPDGLLGAPRCYTLHLTQLLSPLEMIALTFTSSLCLPAVIKLHTFSIQRVLDLFWIFLNQYFRKFAFLLLRTSPTESSFCSAEAVSLLCNY